MLHIILAILKITGIVLAVIVLLFILLLLVCLFVPFGYRIQFEKTGTLGEAKAYAAVRWIFGAVSVEGGYKAGKITAFLRILWIKKYLAGEETHSRPKKAENKRKKKKKKTKREKTLEEEPVTSEEKPGERQEERQEERQQEADLPREMEERPSLPPQPPAKEQKAMSSESRTDKRKKKFHFPDIFGVWNRGRERFRCFRRGIADFGGFFQERWETLRRYYSFLRSEMTGEVWEILKGHLFYLLHHMRPRRIHGRLHYGLGDPCLTGQLTSILYLLLSAKWNRVELEPDFENQVLEGEWYLAGHIRMCHIVKVALQVFFDKKLKVYWKRIKQLRRN